MKNRGNYVQWCALNNIVSNPATVNDFQSRLLLPVDDPKALQPMEITNENKS